MDLRIQARTVQFQTVEKLRAAILSGIFKPGQKLVESALCEQIGIGRSSLREALRRLEAEKLITSIPNKGQFVADISQEEAEQIYHVRAMLEGEACSLYAPHVNADGIWRMSQALKDFERAAANQSQEERLAATSRFYDVILSGCGNEVIAEILQGLLARINFLRARSMAAQGRTNQSAKELHQILEALEKRDAIAARAAAVAHVSKACDVVRKSCKKKEAA